jgi:hypothetical protein
LLARCRELLGITPAEPAADPPADYRDRFEVLSGQSLRACPHCHIGIMVVIDFIPPASRLWIRHDPGLAFRQPDHEAPAGSGWRRLRRDSPRMALNG